MNYKDDVDFKTILTDKYKSYKDKSITKVKKFFNKINMYSDKIIDDDTIDEFIKQIKLAAEADEAASMLKDIFRDELIQEE